jgi:hypothetical protein
MTKPKTPADVPALVDALIAASDQVMAVGDDSYCDMDLHDQEANHCIEPHTGI